MRWSNERIQDALDSRFYWLDSIENPDHAPLVEVIMACKEIMHVMRDEYEKMLPSVETITIGSIIREIRLKKKLGTNQAAKLIDIAPSTLSHLENGKRQPSWLLVEKVCKGLEIETSEVVKMLEKRRRQS